MDIRIFRAGEEPVETTLVTAYPDLPEEQARVAAALNEHGLLWEGGGAEERVLIALASAGTADTSDLIADELTREAVRLLVTAAERAGWGDPTHVNHPVLIEGRKALENLMLDA